MRIFITGGTGTLGKEIVSQLINRKDVEKIVIYSRDEGKHAAMKGDFPEGPPSKLRYRIGDIRDIDRLSEAMAGCNVVVHAAAMKRIDDCSNNVQECIKTNVLGTLNVINSCDYNCVDSAIFISTDKACAAVSAYGASKYIAEHAWIHGNSKLMCKFSVCRYGNVIGSRGSVFGIWESLRDNSDLTPDIPVTNFDATRFFWKLDEAAGFAISCMDKTMCSKFATVAGCIFVPKMLSYKILDIAKNYGNPVEVGYRTVEKTHECLISEDEAEYARDVGDMYIIYPAFHQWASDIDMVGSRTGEVTSRLTCGNFI